MEWFRFSALEPELRRLAPRLGFLGFLILFWLLGWPLLRQNLALSRELATLRREASGQVDLLRQQSQLGGQLAQAEMDLRQASTRFAPPNVLDRVLLDLVNDARTLPDLRVRSYVYRADGTQRVSDARYGPALKDRLLANTIQLELIGSFSSTVAYLQRVEQRVPRLILSRFSTALETAERSVAVGASPAEAVRRSGAIEIVTQMNVTAISLIDPKQSDLPKQIPDAGRN